MNDMRKILSIICLCLLVHLAHAQIGNEAYGFLRLPSSSHASALGGYNVSIIEPDPALGFHNPALLGGEMDNMVNLNYLNYISDINAGSAIYTKAFKERGTWGAGATFFSYGKIKEYSKENEYIGDVSAKDIALQGFFSYDLSGKWRGGLSLKFLYSSMAEYHSMGLGVDAGLSYYDADKKLSFGFAFKNIGAQLKSYYDERQKMPWDIQLGISKQMAHAPLRFSLTAMYLNKWKLNYIDESDKEYKGDSFGKTFLKHLVIGVDWLPSENLWIGVGYNPKRAMDMKLDGANALAGFSAGAGLHVKMFDVSASVAKYHPSALSFMISLSTSLSGFKL